MDPKLDARVRAWRTLVQGLLTDVGLAVLAVVVSAVTGADFAWSSAFWLALLAAVGKSALVAGASYLGRQLLPPANLSPVRQPEQ